MLVELIQSPDDHRGTDINKTELKPQQISCRVSAMIAVEIEEQKEATVRV